MQYVENFSPSSLLDVGFGMGQYGFLARTNLEGINLFRIEEGIGRLSRKEEWRVRIDGIEGCGGYITPIHEYCYNDMMIGNALDILPTLRDQSYELVLAIDILEHFTQSDGLIFLSHLTRVASKAAVVSTPKEFIPQEVPANPYENHRSLWNPEELIENKFAHILENSFSWIAVYERIMDNK
jgi:hypothetical protein